MGLPTDDELVSACFQGECLYGDDFTPEQIRTWYRDEAEAYAQLLHDRQSRAARTGKPTDDDAARGRTDTPITA